jgi:hypothetical protein
MKRLVKGEKWLALDREALAKGRAVVAEQN